MEKMPLGNTPVPDAVPDEACSSGFHRKDWLRSVRDLRFPEPIIPLTVRQPGRFLKDGKCEAPSSCLSLQGGSPSQKSSVSGGLTNLLWAFMYRHCPLEPAGL